MMPEDHDTPPTPSGDGTTPTQPSDDTPTSSSDKNDASLDRTLPMSGVNFAFGPQSWYWIRCGVRYRFVRSTASVWGNLKMDNPYWVAFKHDTGFMIRGDDGRVVHSWNDGHLVRADQVDSFIETRNTYSRLHDWISDQVQSDPEKVLQVSLSIGPKGSYFARCGTALTSHALPKDLQKALKESGSYPVRIALGKNDAWFVSFADGSRKWNLRHVYPSLAITNVFTDSTNIPIFVALNPYVEDEWFIVQKNGTCNFRMTWSKDEARELRKMTDTYMRGRAIRDGSSFSTMLEVDGTLKENRYSPNSRPQESRIEAMLATIRGRTRSMKNGDVALVGAVAGGTGVVAKLVGQPTFRAVGVAASTGIGAAAVSL
ncbi:hypothetical protein DE146DRAFT_791327 [Phaeosphaeria sp. MPI-PUGE-AT-0046c]|nr:hypothetical protein DE146DRAFT_791327 [Phaeosphaeria sp. MPI-PUGE-AT-0046c]